MMKDSRCFHETGYDGGRSRGWNQESMGDVWNVGLVVQARKADRVGGLAEVVDWRGNGLGL